jgi:non-ribosomal peptide synthetase component F
MVQLSSKTTITSIEGICRRVGCTPQAIFQAAWATVISPYLGPRPLFGVVVSGRSVPLEDIEHTIGPIFNTIPCTLSLPSASSWEQLIQQAHRLYSDSIPHQHTPLRLINKWMHASADKPLFDTLFVYQRTEDESSHPPSLWEVMDSPITADV